MQMDCVLSAFPLSGATLRCLSEVPGSEVDGGDNVLLLGYDDGPNTRFYCAVSNFFKSFCSF